MKPSLKCVITHNIKNTTTSELYDLLYYLTSASIFGGDDILIRIVNSDFDTQEFKMIKTTMKDNNIEWTTEDTVKELISKKIAVFLLDSNEIPLATLLTEIDTMLTMGHNITTTVIHMKYKQMEATINGLNVKFKKFIDQPNAIFFDKTISEDIRLCDHYDFAIPALPLSSKWHGWPKTKIVFKTDSKETQRITSMECCIYKFEKINTEEEI